MDTAIKNHKQPQTVKEWLGDEGRSSLSRLYTEITLKTKINESAVNQTTTTKKKKAIPSTCKHKPAPPARQSYKEVSMQPHKTGIILLWTVQFTEAWMNTKYQTVLGGGEIRKTYLWERNFYKKRKKNINSSSERLGQNQSFTNDEVRALGVVTRITQSSRFTARGIWGYGPGFQALLLLWVSRRLLSWSLLVVLCQRSDQAACAIA